MIAVIQYAASKRPGAGRLVTPDGKPVRFVADPGGAPADDTVTYARPDDATDKGLSWRDVLLDYNKQEPDNPLALLPAWQLYDNRVYARLVETLGVGSVYILSAGWGLISASFLTPDYDITFSSVKPKERYKRRKKSDRYRDFKMLAESTREPIVFFGGKDYLPLFAALTSSIRARKTVFYNSAKVPRTPGCVLKRFKTRTRTNWQYECANAFVDGTVRPC